MIDLFAGLGGFSMGFKKAGFNVKYAIDSWDCCRTAFAQNHPDTQFILQDINEIDPSCYKGTVDGIIGSPPCIHISIANRFRNLKEGLKLIVVFLKWVEILQPRFWVMENVEGAIKLIKRNFTDFQIPTIKLLNSVNFGVPQKRIRAFVGNFKVPKPTHSKIDHVNLIGEKIKKWVTVGDTIKDIMYLEPNKGLFQNHDCYSFDEKKINPKNLGTWQGLKILDLNLPSPTITDNHGNTNLLQINNTLRKLTVREILRLQSFPDDFLLSKEIALNHQIKMVGNAVPPLLSYHIANAIKEQYNCNW